MTPVTNEAEQVPQEGTHSQSRVVRRRRGSHHHESAPRRFMREHEFALLWGGAVLLAVFLLFGPLAAKTSPPAPAGSSAAPGAAVTGAPETVDPLAQLLDSSIDAVDVAIRSAPATLGSVVLALHASMTWSARIGWLVLIAAIVVVPIRYRWWLMHQSPALIIRCPWCGGTIQRVHRKPLDRLISRFVPVRHYRCFACHWSGLRIYSSTSRGGPDLPKTDRHA
jgi:hypothetical protein